MHLWNLELSFTPLAPTERAQKYNDPVAGAQILPFLAPPIYWLAEEPSEEFAIFAARAGAATLLIKRVAGMDGVTSATAG